MGWRRVAVGHSGARRARWDVCVEGFCLHGSCFICSYPFAISWPRASFLVRFASDFDFVQFGWQETSTYHGKGALEKSSWYPLRLPRLRGFSVCLFV